MVVFFKGDGKIFLNKGRPVIGTTRSLIVTGHDLSLQMAQSMACSNNKRPGGRFAFMRHGR